VMALLRRVVAMAFAPGRSQTAIMLRIDGKTPLLLLGAALAAKLIVRDRNKSARPTHREIAVFGLRSL
ncbi:MAG TPA: hypothetical protein VGI47_01605, partial [Candidatus Binataceae bacterium]